MMTRCDDGLSLDELLKMPATLLGLTGAEDDPDKGDPVDDEDGEDKDPKDDKSKEPKDEDKDKGADKGKSGELTPEQRRIQNLEEEKDRYYDRRKEAERERDEVKAELAKVKKDGVTDEATKAKLVELEATTTQQEATIKGLRINNAFLTANTHEWVNPATALRLADLSRVEIEKDGTVTGLQTALDKLAKSDPYLLKAAKNDDDSDKDDDDKEKGGKGKKTGDAPASKSKADREAANIAANKRKLQNKYPALRR